MTKYRDGGAQLIEKLLSLFIYLFVVVGLVMGMVAGSQYFVKKWHVSWTYSDGLYIVELSKGKQAVEISGPTIEDIRAGLDNIGLDNELIDRVVNSIRREIIVNDKGRGK